MSAWYITRWSHHIYRGNQVHRLVTSETVYYFNMAGVRHGKPLVQGTVRNSAVARNKDQSK